jgi:transposase
VPTAKSGLVALSSLAKELGISVAVIRGWAERHEDFPDLHKAGRGLTQYGVDRDEFAAWRAAHPEIVIRPKFDYLVRVVAEESALRAITDVLAARPHQGCRRVLPNPPAWTEVYLVMRMASKGEVLSKLTSWLTDLDLSVVTFAVETLDGTRLPERADEILDRRSPPSIVAKEMRRRSSASSLEHRLEDLTGTPSKVYTSFDKTVLLLDDASVEMLDGVVTGFLHDQRWQLALQDVRDYLDEYGRLPLEDGEHSSRELEILEWLASQRGDMQSGGMSPEHTAMLAMIGEKPDPTEKTRLLAEFSQRFGVSSEVAQQMVDALAERVDALRSADVEDRELSRYISRIPDAPPPRKTRVQPRRTGGKAAVDTLTSEEKAHLLRLYAAVPAGVSHGRQVTTTPEGREFIDYVEVLRARGHRVPDIAQHLGVTMDTLHHWTPKRPKRKAAPAAPAVPLHLSDADARELAALHKAIPLKSHKGKKSRRMSTPEGLAFLRRLREVVDASPRGTRYDIASRLGVTRATVTQWLARPAEATQTSATARDLSAQEKAELTRLYEAVPRKGRGRSVMSTPEGQELIGYIDDLRGHGCRVEEIADHLGVSKFMPYRWTAEPVEANEKKSQPGKESR